MCKFLVHSTRRRGTDRDKLPRSAERLEAEGVEGHVKVVRSAGVSAPASAPLEEAVQQHLRALHAGGAAQQRSRVVSRLVDVERGFRLFPQAASSLRGALQEELACSLVPGEVHHPINGVTA